MKRWTPFSVGFSSSAPIIHAQVRVVAERGRERAGVARTQATQRDPLALEVLGHW